MRVGDTNGELLAVPRLNVTRFEVSRGHRGSSRRLAGVGLAIGACVGTAIGYFSFRDTEHNSIDVYAYNGFLIGCACAVVGSVIGAVTTFERWRDLPLESLRDSAMR